MTAQRNLRSLTDNLHVWSPQPSVGWGMANCGLVTSTADRAAALIDTPYDRAMAGDLLDQARPLLGEGTRIDRIVVTHGNGDHHWGAEALPDAEIITTRETLGHIEHEPSPAELHALVHHSDTATVLGWYLNRSFGRFDWTGTQVRQPGILFTGELDLRVGRLPLHLTALPPAHTAGDLIAHLPTEKACFSGDIIFAATPDTPGDHPVHWAGPLDNVISACRQVLATGAEIIIPGHGPVLDRDGVHAHIAYLEYVRDSAHRLHRAGVPALEAARRIIAERRHPELGLPERLAVTVGTEYRHLDGGERPGMPEMIAHVAQLAWELQHPDVPSPRPAHPRPAEY